MPAFDSSLSKEEIMDLWLNYGERDINPFHDLPDPESKEYLKKEEELETAEFELELETTYYFKKSGEFLYIIGDDWPVYDIVIFELFILDSLFDHEKFLGHQSEVYLW